MGSVMANTLSLSALNGKSTFHFCGNNRLDPQYIGVFPRKVERLSNIMLTNPLNDYYIVQSVVSNPDKYHLNVTKHALCAILSRVTCSQEQTRVINRVQLSALKKTFSTQTLINRSKEDNYGR